MNSYIQTLLVPPLFWNLFHSLPSVTLLFRYTSSLGCQRRLLSFPIFPPALAAALTSANSLPYKVPIFSRIASVSWSQRADHFCCYFGYIHAEIDSTTRSSLPASQQFCTASSCASCVCSAEVWMPLAQAILCCRCMFEQPDSDVNLQGLCVKTAKRRNAGANFASNCGNCCLLHLKSVFLFV